MAMKRMILRTTVLSLTVLTMVALTSLSTMKAHGATPTSSILTSSPTSTLVNPLASATVPNPKQPTNAVSAQSATQPAANGSDGKVSRIAFVANRNGALNIYSMDPDGKNIVQLTKTTEYKLF